MGEAPNGQGRQVWWRAAGIVLLAGLFVYNPAQLIAVLNALALCGMSAAALWMIAKYPEEIRALLNRPFEWHAGPLGKFVSQPDYDEARAVGQDWDEDSVRMTGVLPPTEATDTVQGDDHGA